MYQNQSYVFEFHLSCFLMKNYVKMGNFDILVEKLRAIINVLFLKKKMQLYQVMMEVNRFNKENANIIY